jgi:outer membrane immunogenic protein
MGDFMKLHLLAGAAALAFASAANAQDATVTTASPFAGPYVGIQAGIAQLDDRSDDIDYWYDQIGGLRNSDHGAQAGLRVGYDAVFGKVLVGALAEGSIGKLNAFGEASSDVTDPHYAIGTRLTHLGSIRGKLGVTDGRLAAFATGGFAFSNAKHRFRATDGGDDTFDSKADRSGYVLGLGMAYAFNNNMSVGVDYSHYEFGSDTNEVLYSDGDPSDYFFKQDYKVRSLMLSFNYGFGRPAGPVANTAPAPFGGAYIGVQGSIAQVDDIHVDKEYWYTDTSGSITSDRGALIGLRAGYDFLSGNLLAGVMAEASMGRIDTDQETAGGSYDQYHIGTKVKFLGSVRGKLGVAQGNLAVFATAGIAFSDARQRFGDTDGSDEFFSGQGERTGYVLGAGAAWALNDRLTAGLDYSLYEFGTKSHEVMYDIGDPSDYFFTQKYKVRALTLSFNYGF